MSRIAAPSPASSRPWVTAASRSNHSPPSENESGVTLTTPMISKGSGGMGWTLCPRARAPAQPCAPARRGASMDRSAPRRAGAAPDGDDPPSAAARAGLRWGLERVLTAHAREAGEERDLARTLQRALRHLPVVMLHDRLLPGGMLAEHLAVGPG